MEELWALVLVSLMSSVVICRTPETTSQKTTRTTTDGIRRSGSGDPLEESYFPIEDRIVGGELAARGEMPWQVSMKTLFVGYKGLQFGHVCGASIINEFWLISAAHCYYRSMHKKWKVSVGTLNLDRPDRGEQMFEVDAIYTHELFDSASYDYDLALIKIKLTNGRGIIFGKNVQPIYLSPIELPLTNSSEILVSGWGAISSYKQGPQISSKKLKKVLLPYIDRETCQKTQKDQVSVRMFCAGVGGSDACQGDSGGPAAFKGTEGYYVLAGVVSWGDGCGEPNNPGGYTRISEFLDWIENTLNVNSKNTHETFIKSPPEE